MIHDALENAAVYEALHPGFAPAFAFLRRPALAELEDGKIVLDGDRLFAVIARVEARGPGLSPLETHDRYIDIQLIISGTDRMGWQHRDRAGESRGYDADADLELHEGAPAHYLDVDAGQLAIFFPHDAHAPLAGEGTVHKVVIKVASDWRASR